MPPHRQMLETAGAAEFVSLAQLPLSAQRPELHPPTADQRIVAVALGIFNPIFARARTNWLLA